MAARKLTKSERAAIVSRYNGGQGVKSLARDFACGDALIREVLKSAGVVLRGKRCEAVDVSPEEIARLKAELKAKGLARKAAENSSRLRAIAAEHYQRAEVPAPGRRWGGGSRNI